jgi:hypothetical protein
MAEGEQKLAARKSAVRERAGQAGDPIQPGRFCRGLVEPQRALGFPGLVNR